MLLFYQLSMPCIIFFCHHPLERWFFREESYNETWRWLGATQGMNETTGSWFDVLWSSPQNKVVTNHQGDRNEDSDSDVKCFWPFCGLF